jgi:hypothetical protein
MTSTKIQLLEQSYTNEIEIAFLFNDGTHIVSVNCAISQARSLCAMRAPRETLLGSMKDTCPTPHWHMRVSIALELK